MGVPAGTVPGTARQLAIWEDYARRELGECDSHEILTVMEEVAAA